MDERLDQTQTLENEEDYVKKVKGGCMVVSKTGKALSKKMGCQEAHKRLAQIEYFKKHRKGGGRKGSSSTRRGSGKKK